MSERTEKEKKREFCFGVYVYIYNTDDQGCFWREKPGEDGEEKE